MDSLSQECNPLKHRYDACFNAWFEGYLQPIVAAAEEAAAGGSTLSSEGAAGTSSSGDQRGGQSSGTDPVTDEESGAVNASDGPLERSTSSSSTSSTSTTRRLRFPRTRRILTVLFGSAKKPFLTLREQGDLDHPDLWGHQPERVLVAPGEAVLDPRPAIPGQVGGNEEEGEEEDEHDGPEAFDDLDDDESTSDDRSGGSDEESQDLAEREQAVRSERPTELTVQQRAKAKADEYERDCGALFRDYRGCLQGAIDNNQPLSALLDQARLENPLEHAVPLSGGGFGAEGAEP